MKNTLKIVLMLIGLGFVAYGLFLIFTAQPDAMESSAQLYAMIGVGGLFLLGGFAMKKK